MLGTVISTKVSTMIPSTTQTHSKAIYCIPRKEGVVTLINITMTMLIPIMLVKGMFFHSYYFHGSLW